MEFEDKWTMHGLDEQDPRCVKNINELKAFILECGFLPLFRNAIPGFSVEENVPSKGWWTGDESADPWEWRMILAEDPEIAYGKFFNGASGFISADWFPYFAQFKRDGYDFDSTADEGILNRRLAQLMEPFGTGDEVIFSNVLKSLTGLGGAFETALAQAQAKSYLICHSFAQRINKQGMPYGWHVASYCMPELKFGADMVKSRYGMTVREARDAVFGQVNRRFGAEASALKKIFK
ncbi:MAG: hypothetical protein K5784_06810 [Clostridiales bacterium]|nr:hypothetical protein [Clostridiales bacterium]